MTTTGIDKTLETLDDVGELVADAVTLVKRGVGLGSLPRLLEILRDVQALAEDAPAALPELKDVDAVEAGRIATSAYTQVKKIVAAIAA